MFTSRHQAVEETATVELTSTLKMRQSSNIWKRHFGLEIACTKTFKKADKMAERL